jgi:hypothetical protein
MRWEDSININLGGDKSCIFLDIAPRSQLRVNRRFRRTSRLYHQGRRKTQVSAFNLLHCFLLGLYFGSEEVLKMELTEAHDSLQRLIGIGGI